MTTTTTIRTAWQMTRQLPMPFAVRIVTVGVCGAATVVRRVRMARRQVPARLLFDGASTTLPRGKTLRTFSFRSA